jgi:AraC family transcriptional regulator
VRVNPREPDAFGAQHVILRGRARSYHVSGFPGPASLKAVVRGEALWTTDDARFRVDAAAWLFLNRGQRYSLAIDAAGEVETFCIFFRDGFLEQARAALALPPARLLDDPEWLGPPLELAEALRPHGGGVTGALRAALRAVERGDGELALEERVLAAALALAGTREELRRCADRLRAARPGTRLELLRRVLRARDFLEANLERPLTLAELARAACLSPCHLHRSFAAALGETPRAYVTRRRLERARELLTATERPIGDIALALGFASAASFATMYRRHLREAPRVARRAGARGSWSWASGDGPERDENSQAR